MGPADHSLPLGDEPFCFDDHRLADDNARYTSLFLDEYRVHQCPSVCCSDGRERVGKDDVVDVGGAERHAPAHRDARLDGHPDDVCRRPEEQVVQSDQRISTGALVGGHADDNVVREVQGTPMLPLISVKEEAVIPSLRFEAGTKPLLGEGGGTLLRSQRVEVKDPGRTEARTSVGVSVRVLFEAVTGLHRLSR